MRDYKEIFIAKFETAPRHRGRSTWGEKEFETKWEAEKFLEEYRKTHWFASTGGFVTSKVIDLRTDAERAYDERVHERVSRYIDRMWKRM